MTYYANGAESTAEDGLTWRLRSKTELTASYLFEKFLGRINTLYSSEMGLRPIHIVKEYSRISVARTVNLNYCPFRVKDNV